MREEQDATENEAQHGSGEIDVSVELNSALDVQNTPPDTESSAGLYVVVPQLSLCSMLNTVSPNAAVNAN